MKKYAINRIIAALLLFCAMGLQADINNGNGIYGLITDLQPQLTGEQKKAVHDEVMSQDFVLDLNLSNLSSGLFEYEVVSGAIEEAVKKVVPAEQVSAQSGQAIFAKIRAEKGEKALSAVEAVLKHLHAEPLEYVENKEDLDKNDPPIVRIKVPNQMGQTCGVWALANLLAVKKLINAYYLPERADFTRISENLFKEKFKDCPKELVDVTTVAEYATKFRFSHVVVVGIDETRGNALYTYSIVGQKNPTELLQELVTDKIQLINIVVHSKTEKAGRHAEHWTAASIVGKGTAAGILNEKIEDDVVLFMDSIGNEPFQPTNESLKKALRYISRQVTEAYKRYTSE